MKLNLGKTFVNGILNENPTFRLVLGMCPTLAVTTAAINGLGMGAAVIFVLTCSNIAVSLLRKIVPNQIRIPCFVVVIATFVTIVDLIMHAFLPDLHKVLGIFIPLIVVNCIILGRAEAFAFKNNVISSAVDGIGMGVGFTLALTLIGSVREIIGNGTIFGLPVFGASYSPMLVMILPPGAFLTLGSLLGLLNYLGQRRAYATKKSA
ncbi:MAG TPA: electron transport complex subunit E [Clostridia bacterium]|jgi:electron transport complex protein RnfE|nr:electron transport complex subunit E [Clostridia bacterium]